MTGVPRRPYSAPERRLRARSLWTLSLLSVMPFRKCLIPAVDSMCWTGVAAGRGAHRCRDRAAWPGRARTRSASCSGIPGSAENGQSRLRH